MPADLLELFGAENMAPAARPRVMQQLAQLPVSPEKRRWILIQWGRTVGAALSDLDLELVARGAPSVRDRTRTV